MKRCKSMKLVAFVLAVLMLFSTSYDGGLKLGTEVWAGPLSPENAVTFNTGIGRVDKILFIDNQYYVIAMDAAESNMGIYRLDIAAKAFTRVCNVSSLIPGANSFVGYAKIGSEHRFVFSAQFGSYGSYVTNVSTISSNNLQNFTLSKTDAISVYYSYDCNLSYYELDGYYYIEALYTLRKSVYDEYEEKGYRLYKSSDCVNWTAMGREIIAGCDNSVSINVSPTVESTNQKIVLTERYGSYSNSNTGWRLKSREYNLYSINGNNLTEIDHASTDIERKGKGEPYEFFAKNTDEAYSLSNYGKFSFVFNNFLDFSDQDTGATYIYASYVDLYYGVKSYYCGNAIRSSSKESLAYNDDGIYTNKIGTHDKYLYYVYTPKTALPAGTYKINVIAGGSSLTNTTILSLTDYLSSTSVSTPTAIYLKITHTGGTVTYHKLQNGIATTITEEQYNHDITAFPLGIPTSEYQSQGYTQYYADSEKAIFCNNSQKTVKIIYQNRLPEITIVTPSQSKIYGLKDTAIVPQITVSDPDNNALACKYYIDGVEKETKTVAGNTTTLQTVNFGAVNMGTMAEGLRTMKVTVSDGVATVEKTVTFTIDKTPPSITNLTATSTENSITITGSAADTVAGMDTQPYNYTVTDGTSTYTSGWKNQTTHTQGSLQPNRSYTVKLEARDKVGNVSQKTITDYTQAQTPSITASNVTTNTMDITVSDSNPANTQYQIAAGTKYVSQSGALSATAQWITLTNKKIKATGMMPNTTYSLKVKARNGANEETPLSSATVNKTTLPEAPGNLATQPSQNFITLTWSAMPSIIRYEVSADGVVKDAGTQATYIHEGLTPNTQHSYRVRAVNAGGAGAWSSTVTETTLPNPPGVPANLRGEAAQNEISLTWDAVAGAASYELEADGKVRDNITATTYTDSGLTPNTPHSYRVRARNRGGAGNWSDILNIDTLPVPPDTPEGLQIKATTKDTVTLTWNSSERAEAYEIEAGGAIIDSTTEITYTHTGLIPDTEYIYRIRARNRGGESNWTAETIARTLPEKPDVPNNLTATAGTKEITLSWDSAERAVEYDIEADGILIATIPGTSYIHEGLESDTKHTYRVKARNAGGESEYSAAVTAYTLTETTGMALTNVAAVVTNTSITLMWDAVAVDVEYDVEADGEIKDNGRDTAYIHGGLQPVTSHTYKIRPKKGEEAGPWCAVLAIFTLPNMPDAPGNIKAVVTNTTIQLMWDAEEGATGYDIEIDGTKVESTADTTYIHKDLIPGTEHSYRIRAVNIAGTTPWSEAIVKSTIKPTYMIEAEAGKEYHVALTAMGMQEFGGKKLVLAYNPEEVEIVDLCEETRAIELESGRIPGSGIKLNHTEGRIELEVDRRIDAGKAWTGVMNTILIRSRVDGQISLDYSVE